MKKAKTRALLIPALAALLIFAAISPQIASAAAQLAVDLTQPDASEPEDIPGDNIEVEIVRRDEPEDSAAPLRVLIYHSHTCEAYEPDYDGQYVPTERWRTRDTRYSVVRLGAALAAILRVEYGMEVVHDDTNFEIPSMNNAYARSLEALENYFARGETFDLYIDLHRDAYIDGLFSENTVSADGRDAARLMILIGTGEGKWNGRRFAQKPDWEQNLSLANTITDNINARCPGLCRKPSVKTGRYNQHVSPAALLVEVGNNRNSLYEALAAVPELARGIYEVFLGETPLSGERGVCGTQSSHAP